MVKQKSTTTTSTQRATRSSSKVAEGANQTGDPGDQGGILIDNDTSFHEEIEGHKSDVSNGGSERGEDSGRGVDEAGLDHIPEGEEQEPSREPIKLVLKNGRFVNLNQLQDGPEGDSSSEDSEPMSYSAPKGKSSSSKKKDKAGKGKSSERVAWLEEIVREVKSGHLNRVRPLQKRFYDKYGDNEPRPSSKKDKEKRAKRSKLKESSSKSRKREKSHKKKKGKRKPSSDSSSSSSDSDSSSNFSDSDSPAPLHAQSSDSSNSDLSDSSSSLSPSRNKPKSKKVNFREMKNTGGVVIGIGEEGRKALTKERESRAKALRGRSLSLFRAVRKRLAESDDWPKSLHVFDRSSVNFTGTGRSEHHPSSGTEG
ncbi:uncharacterized protein MELLADRAFT_63959 [Melampsora larici-populina 98AG31]|uniref:Uncharacterized protein n=1 Tax=Melampsora larici-populina (strain 98AG31 / pathotype 3-4-7) TaxID=747676 RepID=F4RPM6_MELLP|nr:uncharacterized protein MELLADRAFT_63959 [Melampsora larici-populina 98AG31]EGG05562.1 hypothetical protein MELLADRAFT_63959 [Melampsora larici-populina 98AG31]